MLLLVSGTKKVAFCTKLAMLGCTALVALPMPHVASINTAAQYLGIASQPLSSDKSYLYRMKSILTLQLISCSCVLLCSDVPKTGICSYRLDCSWSRCMQVQATRRKGGRETGKCQAAELTSQEQARCRSRITSVKTRQFAQRRQLTRQRRHPTDQTRFADVFNKDGIRDGLVTTK